MISPVAAVILLVDEHGVAVENAGLDHRVAAHFERVSARRSPAVSGGTMMVWLWVWIASIGVPAAMRPMTGMVTERPASKPRSGHCGIAARRPARPPRLPSMTLRLEPGLLAARATVHRVPAAGSLPAPGPGWAGDGWKPRSSSAVISRWMPDLERRSSASFISSKEGGMPASFMRSWMNMSSSCCLRVNMGVPRRAESEQRLNDV